MPSPEIQTFFSWFQSHKGYIDTSVMDVVDFPLSEGGRGAIALADIPANHTVFSIPRSLVLSCRTSTLPAKMGATAWKKFGLHKGWVGLILCMMWEASRGDQSLWAPYFDTLPTEFDTPMFWSEQDLQELKGTSVVDKLGKEEAENDYTNKVLPAIRSRPDLFPEDTLTTRFSLSVFHMMGTRISSRSFTLTKEDEEQEQHEQHEEDDEEEGDPAHVVDQDEDEDKDVGDTSMGSAMDVDEPPAENVGDHDEDEDDEDEDEDEDDEDEDEDEDDGTEVTMVPLADILNARYKSENVKLFYERDTLKMVSTREIKAGEQIWNTYGDLPNAELLRCYGHVDYLPLHPSFSFSYSFDAGTQQEREREREMEYGNPGDTVDVRADLVVRCVLDSVRKQKEGEQEGNVDVEERIDWWLEEGGDDVFTLEHPALSLSLSLPGQSQSQSQNSISPEDLTTALTPPLLSFIRLVQMTPQEWAKVKTKKKKGRPPKPVPREERTLRILLDVIGRRMEVYGHAGTVEDRQFAQVPASELLELELESVNMRRRRHALVVRLGEKRVLDGLRRFVEQALKGLLDDGKGKGKGNGKGKGKEKEKTMSRVEKRKDVDDGEKEKEKGGSRKRRK